MPYGELGDTTQDLSTSNLYGSSLPAKTLALTFDDGPGARTAELSQYLKAQGIRATFFVNGTRVVKTTLPNTNPITPNAAAALAQLLADGHLVANHGTTHRSFSSEVAVSERVAEIAETDAVIDPYVSPSHVRLFRAPYGAWNTSVYTTVSASAMGKYVGPIFWEIGGDQDRYPQAAADWACWAGRLTTTSGAPANGTGYASSAQCGEAYFSEIQSRGRGMVLFHDPNGSSRGNTVDMVKLLVPRLKSAGYTFVRVDEIPAIAALLPCDASCSACSGPQANQCTSCKADHYLKGGSCAICETCGTSQYQVAACAQDANVVCAACDSACVTCSGPGADQCIVRADVDAGPGNPGATQDAGTTACGSCDDNNACTVDTCTASNTCAHTPKEDGACEDAAIGCAAASGRNGLGTWLGLALALTLRRRATRKSV